MILSYYTIIIFLRLAGISGDCPVQLHCLGWRWLVLTISKAGNSTAFLGNLVQCSTSLRLKEFILKFKCSNLHFGIFFARNWSQHSWCILAIQSSAQPTDTFLMQHKFAARAFCSVHPPGPPCLALLLSSCLAPNVYWCLELSLFRCRAWHLPVFWTLWDSHLHISAACQGPSEWQHTHLTN